MVWRVALLIVAGMIDIGLFGRMLWGYTGIMEYQALKQQYAQMQARIAELDAKNLALSRDIRLMQSDRAYMEKMIRQKLRYLRDNEIVYLFPDAKTGRTGAPDNERKN